MPNIVKNTTIINPLDFLAPHSCRGCGRLGYALCNRCKNYILTHRQNLCPHCKTPTPTGVCPNCPDLPPTFIIDERSTLIGTLTHDYKYHSVRALAHPIAILVDHILPPTSPSTAIVPLPTASNHIRTRGFDHTHLLARHLAKLRHCEIARLLIRSRNTSQVGTSRNLRLTQANTAFTLSPKAHIDPSTAYVLLDDVWTTGASIRACLEKLRQAGADHLIVALLALSRID